MGIRKEGESNFFWLTLFKFIRTCTCKALTFWLEATHILLVTLFAPVPYVIMILLRQYLP